MRDGAASVGDSSHCEDALHWASGGFTHAMRSSQQGKSKPWVRSTNYGFSTEVNTTTSSRSRPGKPPPASSLKRDRHEADRTLRVGLPEQADGLVLLQELNARVCNGDALSG